MFTAAAMLLSMGCAGSIVEAPFGSTITVPSGLEINWSTSLQERDLAGLVQLFDVVVLDPQGEPLENTRVEIITSFAGVMIVPQEAIELVGYPAVPEEITSQEDVREYCTDEYGNYTLVEDWCAWYWDSVNDQYYHFAGTYADNYTSYDTGGAYWFAPTYVEGTTDNRGTFRAYLLIDSLPDGEAPVTITATIGVDSDSFQIIQPQ